MIIHLINGNNLDNDCNNLTWWMVMILRTVEMLPPIASQSENMYDITFKTGSILIHILEYLLVYIRCYLNIIQYKNVLFYL